MLCIVCSKKKFFLMRHIKMDEKRKIYENFMSLNAQKATTTTTPTAHVMFYEEGKTLSPFQPLISMSIENVQHELDQNSELVRQLLRQMSTYDCHRQKIVGLIFDSQTVISDVLRA
jgi:hypothetical protein